MQHFYVKNLREGYRTVCEDVLRHGDRVAPRGQGTYELLGVTLEVEDLWDTLPLAMGRQLNLEIAALEALQLIGEVTRPDLLVTAAPRFGDFREADGSFHGPYGLRVRGQTARVLERIREDPVTRQAVVTVWDPYRDGFDSFRDMPCTVALHLLPRHGRLHLQVYMRSNDVWLGLAYDYFVFSQWLLTCAAVLGFEPGRYTHHVGSLHLYERDVERVEQLTEPAQVTTLQPLPLGLDVETVNPHGSVARSWEQVRLRAVGLLDRPDEVSSDSSWYRNQLLRVHEKLEESRVG